MKTVAIAIILALAPAAPSPSLWRHWAVSTEPTNSDSPRVVFTLIGSSVSRKLPILILTFRENTWTAMLTCGDRLQGRTNAKLLMSWDGYPEKADWRMTSDHTATFAVTPEHFITRLLHCHALEVDFPLADEPRHAIFDVTGLEKEIDNFPRVKKALEQEKAKRMLLVSHRPPGGPITYH
jgi:hypothetical protein